MGKLPMEDKWLSGQALGPGMTRPGLIRCAVVSWPELDNTFGDDPNKFAQLQIDDFFVEGYNRYNELFQALNGKVFLITLRKGQDMTSPTVSRLIPADTKGPA